MGIAIQFECDRKKCKKTEPGPDLTGDSAKPISAKKLALPAGWFRWVHGGTVDILCPQCTAKLEQEVSTK